MHSRIATLGLLVCACNGSSGRDSGVLDESFGDGGVVTLGVGSSDDRARAVLALSDGRLLAGGSVRFAESFDDDFALLMLDANGAKDTTFGALGVVYTEMGSQEDEILSLAIAPDGKIVASGIVTSNGIAFIAVARYLPDGDLDTTFDGDGRVQTPIHASFSDQGTPLAVLSDGSLLVAGNDGGSVEDFAVVKLDPNGAVDTSFGIGGMRTLDILGHDYAYCVAVDSQDRIVLAGGDFDLKLARFDANGNVDSSFGENGSVRADVLGRTEEALAMALREDGRIVVLANALETATFDLDGVLAGFLEDGSPDPAFGASGFVSFDWGHENTGPAALSLQANGLAVIAGTGELESASDTDFFVVRFDESTMDLDFGDAGRTITDFGDTDVASAIAIDAEGRIVVAGSAQRTFDTDFAFARYLP